MAVNFDMAWAMEICARHNVELATDIEEITVGGVPISKLSLEQLFSDETNERDDFLYTQQLSMLDKLSDNHVEIFKEFYRSLKLDKFEKIDIYSFDLVNDKNLEYSMSNTPCSLAIAAA